MSCLIVDDLVLIDEQGLLHQDLIEFYEKYRQEKITAGETPLSPRQWIPSARGTARQVLSKLLGNNLHRAFQSRTTPVLIDLLSVPRPSTLTEARLTAKLQELLQADNLEKTWERLSRLTDSADEVNAILRSEQRVNLGYLRILKGNVAEVLSMPEQLRVLREVKQTYPDAVLLSGVRMRSESSGASRLFSDNIIARWRSDGSLEVRTVFEIKSGYRGGGEAVEQVFEWTEGRIGDGFQLILSANSRYYDFPAGASSPTSSRLQQTFEYTYDPERISSGPRVISLISAERRIITARGTSQIGVDSSLTTVGRRTSIELDVTSSELDYLSVCLLQTL